MQDEESVSSTLNNARLTSTPITESMNINRTDTPSIHKPAWTINNNINSNINNNTNTSWWDHRGTFKQQHTSSWNHSLFVVSSWFVLLVESPPVVSSLCVFLLLLILLFIIKASLLIDGVSFFFLHKFHGLGKITLRHGCNTP